MRLSPHPDSRPPAITVESELARFGAAFAIRYLVRGDVSAIRMPPPAPAVRTDELWKHTCFEAFVAPEAGDSYFEFNFAPSSAWAAYGFSAYREGMHALDGVDPPIIEHEITPDGLLITVSLFAPNVARIARRVALTAVIEDTHGERSYWALAHAPGKPDFHHRAGFVLELPPSEQT